MKKILLLLAALISLQLYANDTIWVQGFQVPKQSDFKTIAGVRFLPSDASKGWYDVDKFYVSGLAASADYKTDDYNMCWAATTSNLLHNFFDKNNHLLSQLSTIDSFPQATQSIHALGGDSYGQISQIMEAFKRKYDDRGGYVSSAIPDFLMGTYKMDGVLKNEFTTQEIYSLVKVVDIDYTVKSMERFTEIIRDLVDNNYSIAFSAKTTFQGNPSHALTAWGFVLDSTNVITRYYGSNSDDQWGIIDYKLGLDENNKPSIITTGGKFWPITEVVGLADGQQLIQSHLQATQLQQTLQQKPEVYINNDQLTIANVNEPCQIYLFDANGSLITTLNPPVNQTINVSNLNNGLYIIQLVSVKGVQTIKWIKD